ncbi:MAG TPA: hypothetical protein VJT77_03205 [Burkholderiales bacterium]|nr:hypothetical protein [Burkholderiales bacterium]
MIDRVVLEQVAARHLATMQSPSGVSLLVHLHGGARYTVHGFEEFLDACCVVRVYPADDDLKDEMPFLTLTAREPENRSTIGFQTQWTAKKQS